MKGVKLIFEISGTICMPKIARYNCNFIFKKRLINASKFINVLVPNLYVISLVIEHEKIYKMYINLVKCNLCKALMYFYIY